MKNIFKPLVVLLLAFSLVSNFSQASEKNSGAFLFDPLPLFLGVLTTEVEFNINETLSLGPEVGGVFPLFEIDDLSYFGIFGGARANFYLGGGIHDSSFYVSPRLGVSYFSVESDTDDASLTTFYLGAIAGYRWLLENTVIKLGAGLKTGLGDTKVTIDGQEEDVSFAPAFTPVLEFSFGFRF